MSTFRFEPTWESLKNYTVPKWFSEAKLGIFIHWGVYSVPAFDNEWYSRNMYLSNHHAFKHHQEKWGHQSKFGYKDFIPLFKAEHFDPDAWAALFKQAGARYVVPVAEHHDGFPMYDSGLSEWNAARMGPKRDVIGELAKAIRKQDMVFGVSNHRAEHWWFFDGGMRFESDVTDPRYAGLYAPAMPASRDFTSQEWASRDWQPRPDARFLDDWLARCCELVQKYDPQLFYFDWWIEQIVFQPYLQKFASWYYNHALDRGYEVALTHKFSTFPEGTAVYDIERGRLSAIRPKPWQTDTSLSYKSWCYIEDDHFKSAATLIHNLADIVSKNGNLLINVGPKADGTIPPEAESLLISLGNWLKINGEAIYGTHTWHTFGEGNTPHVEGHMREHEDKPYDASDIRFTAKDNALYAICLGWPGSRILIQSLANGSPLSAEAIENIHMLGSDQSLAWSQSDAGLEIETPPLPPCEHAFTFKITLKA